MIGAITAGITGLKDENISVEYLVIAGGGGGGSNHGGGAGAGGYRTAAGFLCTPATNFTVTVGAGGAAGPGVQGNNSVFSTITSAGGGFGANNVSTGVEPGGNGGSGVGLRVHPPPGWRCRRA